MPLMKSIHTCLGWGLGVVALLLSPIVVIFGTLLAAGIVLDIFDLAGGGPIALALCAPVVFLLVRRAAHRALVHRLAAALWRPRQPLDPAAKLTTALNYAPKSIS
jgi:hypothetical protein